MLVGLYFLLAAGGAAGTWYFNVRFDAGAAGVGYYEAWFANPASSSAAVDVFVTAGVFFVFLVAECVRLRRWWLLALVPLTFLVALACTFPLLLAARELLPRPEPTDGRP